MKLLSLLIVLGLITGCASQTELGADDPLLWLEEVEGKEALQWVNKQNEKTLKEMTADSRYKSLEKAALTILEDKNKIPNVSMRGKYLYNFWRDGKHVRGLWRRTTLQSYKKKNPLWETVIDVDQLAKTEKENWVFKGANCWEPAGVRCLVSLSRGGKDASVVREFDTKTKKFVKDGFKLKEAKSRLSWLDENTTFVATDFGKGSLTKSGYPRILKVWKRGTPLAQAKTIFEATDSDLSVYGATWRHPSGDFSFVSKWVTFFTSQNWIYEKGELKQLPLQDSAILEGFLNGHFIVKLRKDWKVGGVSYKAGSLVALKKSIVGKKQVSVEEVQVIYPSPKNGSILNVMILKDKILINTLENVRGKVYQVQMGKKSFAPARLLNLIKGAHLLVSNTDPYQNNFFFMYRGFTRPDALYYYSDKKGVARKVKSLPAKFNSRGMGVKQMWATSKDGTKVPYFLVGKKSVIKKGQAPTLLYGYGGFEVSRTPGYNALTGKLWLEKGGLYAIANIRGGGEFGPAWHQAALKTKRHKAYDDFIAVAEDMVAKEITNKDKLAIQGGSNGGLLVGAVMTRRPDLFKAVLCHVPLLDMLRYSRLLAGASWVGEYGDPQDPKMREYLMSYSPYQKVKADKKYPELFLLTSTKDDRVHPGHARKMAAKMIKQGHKNVRYYENTEGGHAGAANLKQTARMRALTYEFLFKTIY